MRHAASFLLITGSLVAAGCAARTASPAQATPAPRLVLAQAVPAEPAAAPTPAAPPPSSEPPAERHSNRTLRSVGWISLAIGAGAAVVAVGTSLLILHEKGVRSDNCDANKVCVLDGSDANNSIGSNVGWNTASWIVAAVGVGAGAFLLLTNPKEPSRSAAVGVSPAGSGLGLSFRGAF
jgi:hypothetical protein